MGRAAAVSWQWAVRLIGEPSMQPAAVTTPAAHSCTVWHACHTMQKQWCNSRSAHVSPCMHPQAQERHRPLLGPSLLPLRHLFHGGLTGMKRMVRAQLRISLVVPQQHCQHIPAPDRCTTAMGSWIPSGGSGSGAVQLPQL